MARGMFSLSNLKKMEEANSSIASLFLLKVQESILRSKEDYKPSVWYKPSSLVCMRQMYFTRKGIEMDKTQDSMEMIGILESGTDRHERIQQAIVNMEDLGLEFKYIDVEEYVKENNLEDIEIISKQGMETKCFNKRYNLSFLTDGIIKHIPTGKYYIFEFKTEVSQKFSKREEEELTHTIQASAYALSFGIDEVLFLYEDRNFCSKKCYLHKVTEEDKLNKIINKIEKCEDYLKNAKIPPKITNKDIDPEYIGGKDRVAGPSSKVCMYCKYKSECSKFV